MLRQKKLTLKFYRFFMNKKNVPFVPLPKPVKIALEN